MAQATVSIRMDAELKQAFERLCKDMGMNMTTAFTNLARQSVRESRIPEDPFYCEANMAYIREGIEELNAGKGILVSMEELDAIVAAKTGGVL